MGDYGSKVSRLFRNRKKFKDKVKQMHKTQGHLFVTS